MDRSNREVSVDVFPYIRVYKDGTFERLAGTQVVPAGLDPQTGVLSKDIVIIPESKVSARLYRPNNITEVDQKLPLVVYFHGGAFCISSVSDPVYHNSINMIVAEANIMAVSVDYRRAPEHPLPAAYEDAWLALRWVASQVQDPQEAWLKDHVDFERVFLAGDSAGANISHHMALRLKESNPTPKLKIVGIAMINPYFWGQYPIGSEAEDPVRKAMVDKWWMYVCPSEKGNDDPLINPFAEGDWSTTLAGLGCEKVLVILSEKDILRDRGRLYYDNLVKSIWKGKAEIMETEAEDHVFHIFNPNCEKAKALIKRLASFINQS
ncbi:hypothetical protein FNV43_RR11862 [Rhamnella rubrinervis]|uniref:Alpha/beta hydrolase fold-3 domain-containing protein n=1 Tax=Rhamnella rubrinervis TaxID=2594499 RepID=A0A8K0H6H1_9ROSA|nr:hypothetical protein FNV43_RR11862 [Rhamnella rubrinervis]